MTVISLIATLAMVLLFVLSYRRNKASLLTGFLFDVSLAGFGATYFLLAVTHSDNAFFNVTLVLLALIVLVVLLFGAYALVAGLLLNARLMFKRERHTLANSLPLLTALGILLLMLLSLLAPEMPFWLRDIWAGVNGVAIYYAVHVCVFLTTVVLCNFSRPKKNQDYIVVLGSGLINDEVPPLLAARIDRAITFGEKQAAAGAKRPVLVLSGGKGADESRAEAEAMHAYATGKGWPPEALLLEDKSANTRENMLFSKRLMDERSGAGGYRCLYATNNYHLLRAGICARRAGLRANGIGARTAPYYLPGALMREYLALLSMNKRLLVLTAGLVFLFTGGFALAADLLAYHSLRGVLPT